MRAALLALLLCGCAGTQASQYVNAAVQVSRAVAELVKARTGRDIDDVTVVCDEEWSTSGTLLLLCEVNPNEK